MQTCVGWVLANPSGCNPPALQALAVQLRPDALANNTLEGNKMKDLNPAITCADGFTISVQARDSAYCTPREDYPGKPYTHVECGFPSSKPLTQALLDYAERTVDYTETVYAYVPIAVVQAEIDAHGGVSVGCLLRTKP